MTCSGYGRISTWRRRRTREADGRTRHDAARDARSLWITQQQRPADIVLTAGDTWTVERNGRTIVEAQDDSSLSLIGDAVACVDTRGRRPSWMARVVAWLERVEAARGRRWAPYL